MCLVQRRRSSLRRNVDAVRDTPTKGEIGERSTTFPVLPRHPEAVWRRCIARLGRDEVRYFSFLPLFLPRVSYRTSHIRPDDRYRYHLPDSLIFLAKWGNFRHYSPRWTSLNLNTRVRTSSGDVGLFVGDKTGDRSFLAPVSTKIPHLMEVSGTGPYERSPRWSEDEMAVPKPKISMLMPESDVVELSRWCEGC